MTSAARTIATLKRKQAALTAAVNPWLDADHENTRFPRMVSQTSAAVNLLRGVLAGIAGAIDANQLPATTIENRILGGYQFWNVFRSKFAQRLQDDLERFLRAADELAWVCYEPARSAALGPDDPRAKEPPLVYLSAVASPFVDPRGARFQPEGMPAYLIESQGWPEATRRLPFAMIGVPWFQSAFLPGALAIAHEVGHSVEADFALDNPLDALIDAAAPDRAAQWKSWRAEVFADLWGCLALGPAFVQALAEAIWPAYQANPHAASREYPPAPLRIWWNCQVLAQNNFPAKIADFWPDAANPPAANDDCDDALRIAESWLSTAFAEFNNRKLAQILDFDSERHELAAAQAKSAQDNTRDESRDIRALWAAIQLAWSPSATDLLLGRILNSASSAPRARADTPDQKAKTEKARADYIVGQGRDIFS